MSELHKFGALNLRAKSEKVKTTTVPTYIGVTF